MAVLDGCRHVDKTMRKGILAIVGSAVCMGAASLDTLWPKSSRAQPGSLLPMLFELETLLTWTRESRLEYEVGS